MPKLLLNKCCFCIDLRVGCFIIGYLELIGTVIAMLALIIRMAAGGAMVSAAAEMRAHSDTEQASLESEINARAGGRMMFVTGFLLFVVALTMAFVIIFIVGLHQKKRAHILAFFIYSNVVQAIEFIIFAIVCFIQLVSAYFVIGNLIVIFLHVYFLMVVRDYYVKMYLLNDPVIHKT